MFASSAPALPHIRSGRLRALGISSPQRSIVAPDIPTVAESGVAGYEAVVIFGLLAPAKTPRPVIELLNEEAHKAMRTPEAGESMKALGGDVVLTTPDGFGRVIEAEVKRWSGLVRNLNLRVE
jgi:tripartite-type tricarboxylate transporter receptor subunit TctC